MLGGIMIHPTLKNFKNTFNRSVSTTVELFKVLIPLSIAVKILQESGAVALISDLLSPVMGLVGLPGLSAVVWTTVFLVNIYAGVVILASLSTGLSLTVAQTTILASMCLIAHTLPVEAAVARKAGVSVWFTVVLRLGGALLFGWLLFKFYSATGWQSEKASGFLIDSPDDPSIRGWITGEIRRLFLIFVTIVALHTMLDILKWLGVTDFIVRRCRGLLGIFGMSEEVGPLVVIGMLMGIVYGGGLIISEAKRHTIADREVFAAMSLLALLHAVIEDTAIMVLIGGSLSGVLWGRMLFAAAMTFLIVQIAALMPDKQFKRLLFAGTA